MFVTPPWVMWPLQRVPIPVAGHGGRLVGGLGKCQERVIRGVSSANVVIRQDIFSQRAVIGGVVRLDRVTLKSRWFGVRISIKGWCTKAGAGPESAATYLMGIGLPHHEASQVRRARMCRRATAGKPCDRQIKASPEKVDRARFAEKPSSELAQDPMRLQEDAPAALCVLRIIGRMPVDLPRTVSGPLLQPESSKWSPGAEGSPMSP